MNSNEKLLRFLDFFEFVRKLGWWHFCSSGGKGNGTLVLCLHSGRVVVNLSNSKRRRLVRNSALAFRYFGSRHNAVKTFGFTDEPLASIPFSGFFSIFNWICSESKSLLQFYLFEKQTSHIHRYGWICISGQNVTHFIKTLAVNIR